MRMLDYAQTVSIQLSDPEFLKLNMFLDYLFTRRTGDEKWDALVAEFEIQWDAGLKTLTPNRRDWLIHQLYMPPADTKK